MQVKRAAGTSGSCGCYWTPKVFSPWATATCSVFHAAFRKLLFSVCVCVCVLMTQRREWAVMPTGGTVEHWAHLSGRVYRSTGLLKDRLVFAWWRQIEMISSSCSLTLKSGNFGSLGHFTVVSKVCQNMIHPQMSCSPWSRLFVGACANGSLSSKLVERFSDGLYACVTSLSEYVNKRGYLWI